MTKEELLQTYFYIEDISGSENTVSITKNKADSPTLNLEYSTDGSTWTTATMNEDTTANTFTIPANSKLYLRGQNNGWCASSNNTYYNAITCSGNHNVGGNVMSLLHGSEFIGKTTFPSDSSSTLDSLFNINTTLVNAQDLQLPATTLTNDCYSYMFNGCSSLKTTPELPATTLAGYCYHKMFLSCTSLTTAPELPATTLANNCYYWMFAGCSRLTTAPELPATTLTPSCYYYMFYDCKNLTTAPVLPATTLAQNCYSSMFNNCSKLNYIKADFINYDSSYFTNWVQNVSSTGTFVMNPEATYDIEQIRGVNGIPQNWNIKTGLGCIFMNLSDNVNYLTLYRNNENSTNINDINLTYNTGGSKWITIEDLSQPIEFRKQLSLRGINSSLEGYSFSCTESYSVNGNIMELLLGEEADTLGNVFPENSVNTFKSLFKNDKNLLSVGSKVLPSMSLVKGCYSKMFLGCSNMENCPDLPATELSEKCYVHMFTGCSKLQNVPNLPATNLTNSCYHGMFMNCDNISSISLPNSNLANYCYSNMFLGSDNLTEATINTSGAQNNSLNGMFKKCSTLNKVTIPYDNNINSTNLTNWLQDVADEGNFIYKSSSTQTESVVRDKYLVPNNWTVTRTS